MSEASVLLHDVATRLGKRVKKCECYDQNVCDFKTSPEQPWQFVLLSGHPFAEEVRASYRDRRVHLMASPEHVRCSLGGRLDTDVCSINQPNKVSCVTKATALLVSNDPRWPVFISSSGEPSETLRSLLDSSALHVAVRQLIRNELESLHLFRDQVTVYFKPQTADEVIAAIDTLSHLVGPFSPEVDRIDLTILPPQLHSLIPLIRRWAISDDGDRADALDDASPSELEELVSTVESHFGDIDQYLGRIGNQDVSEVATALNRLGECMVEAQLKLKRSR
jgi:hypothetical protein